VRKADILPPSCAVVTKSGNLNFLEPSGPLRDFNGSALPLPLPKNQSGPTAYNMYFVQCNATVTCNAQVYESCFGSEVVKEVRQEMKAACAKCAGVSATAPGQAVPSPADPADKKKLPLAAVPPTFDATRLQQAILGFRSPVQQVSETSYSLPIFLAEKIKGMRWAEHATRMVENRHLYEVFVGQSQ